MPNLSRDEILFLKHGDDLDAGIRDALQTSSRWVVESWRMQQVNLEDITTKTNYVLAYPAFVNFCTLKDDYFRFDEAYVNLAFEIFSGTFTEVPHEKFNQFTRAGAEGKWRYKRTWAIQVRRGIGSFLLALHVNRSIVLPFSYKWPTFLDSSQGTSTKRTLCNVDELPELLRFMASLDASSAENAEETFNSMSLSQRRRLASYGTKLIISLGWMAPSDANMDDIKQVKRSHDQRRLIDVEMLPISFLIDILERKYGGEIEITSRSWHDHMRYTRNNPIDNHNKLNRVLTKKLGDMNHSSDYLLEPLLDLKPSEFYPENLEKGIRLPGIEFDMQEKSEVWVRIQKAYLKKIKKENIKEDKSAIGILNIYLFAYLPYWYNTCSRPAAEFPSTPEKLIGAIFISDIGIVNEFFMSLTLVEFIKRVAAYREWKQFTHWKHLKSIEAFFQFIETFSDQLPNSRGFRKTLSEHDYPPISRLLGTNKRPIPKQIFPFFISYVESLKTYIDAVINGIVSGTLTENDLSGIGVRILDTFAWQNVIGFVPTVFFKEKVFPLRYIPNLLSLTVVKLKDGRKTRLPYPHAVNQILVALYTGIRNQHIQWLDAKSFDFKVEDDSAESTLLFVNTDKVRQGPWTPFVQMRVIEILRDQKKWRNLIADRDFDKMHFYENNPRTKWPKILPLFSLGVDGRPHSDTVYETAWKQILSGIQSMAWEIGEPGLVLLRLLPQDVRHDDPDLNEKLISYGKKAKGRCELHVSSDITPHSARSSVVSHLISILPAEAIGQYITGQSRVTVGYYTRLDKEGLHAAKQLQNLIVGGSNSGSSIASELRRSSVLIKADSVNSSLAKSLMSNLDETIISHGVTSFSVSDLMKTGLDVLRESRGEGAAFNLTEVCPYGNHCPSDVAQKIGSRRCSMCPYAVRSIDHLPAVAAKTRQVLEEFNAVEKRLDSLDSNEVESSSEWKFLEEERFRFSEELTAWMLVLDVLEKTRLGKASGDHDKKWVVEKPEILRQQLEQTSFPSPETTEYLLSRLGECIAYPGLESPHVRARFEVLRRRLAAGTGRFNEVLSLEIPANPAAECAGMIRSLVERYKLSDQDLINIINTDLHLDFIQHSPLMQLTGHT